MRCVNCKTHLPVEFGGNFCSVKCGQMARATTEERTAEAIAAWLDARAEAANTVGGCSTIIARDIRDGLWRKP